MSTTLWVLLVVALEVAFLLWLPWHVAALLLFLYTLRWVDRAEFTGHAAWSAWRSGWWWRLFSPVAEVHLPVTGEGPAKSIYLVTPCATLSTLFWGMGIGTRSGLYYMADSHLFWVPLMRDWFLWSGAVAQTQANVVTLLAAGHSVCYAMPPPAADLLVDNTTTTTTNVNELRTLLPSDWLLTMAIQEGFKLQIVTVQGEDEQYHCYAHGYWRRLRCLCAKRIHLYYGTKIDAQAYQSVDDLAQALTTAIQRNSITALGDKVIKAQ
jgi:hypothetical protein